MSKYVQSLIRSGRISEGHARLLVGLSEREQKLVADEVVKRQLSVRETEVFIRKLKNKKATRKTHVEKFTSDLLNRDVYVQKGKRGGKLIIKFRNKEELEELSKALKLGG